MADKEIEKALEFCSEKECNMDCPYRDKNFAGIFHCEQKNRDALDYINRLKVENEELCSKNRILSKMVERLHISDQSKENCTIQQHADIHKLREKLRQIRKETAKEIIEIMKRVQSMFYDKEYVAIQNLIAEKYGVEVDE